MKFQIFIVSLLVLTICITGLVDAKKKKEEAPADDAATTSGDGSTFYTFKRDQQKCGELKCGGVYLSKVNGITDEIIYIAQFKYKVEGVNKSVVEEAPDHDVIVSGTIVPHDKEYNDFLVADAYRVLATSAASTNNETVFYQFAGLAKGSSKKTPAYNVAKVNDAAKPFLVNSYTHQYPSSVQATWIESVLHAEAPKSAIVCGQVATVGTGKKATSKLTIDKIFIHLPDPSTPCPKMGKSKCSKGTVQVFKRDEARCLAFDGCVKSGPCTLELPVCNEGYQIASWAAQPKGCLKYQCDPDFL
eukprot:gene5635-6504_t